jgi:hypothetical protein
MRALVLWVLLAPAFAQAQTNAAPAALDAIAQCSEAAGDLVAEEFALEQVCPDFDEALNDSGYAPFISPAQRAELTADSLADLHELMVRAERPQAAARGPDLQALPAILESLDKVQQKEPPLSWWERFKRWLRQRLGRDAGDASWLDRFELNPSVARALVVTSIVLVILLALAVLINELRVAGVFRRDGARRGQSPVATASSERTPTWSDLDRMAPGERPSFVLRMLVAALVRTGRLRTERSLTHREVSARATLEDEAQRACLTRVATLAERTVYGGAALDPDTDAILAQGRDLHARLSAGTP